MKQVRDRLFIGNITDANIVIQSTHLNVTHMLSLLSNQVLSRQNSKCGYPYSVVTMRAGVHYLPVIPVCNDPAVGSHDGEPAVEPSETGREFLRMTVPLRDMESENLLDHLEPCLEFIANGREIGDVLVHCVAGVSRSASVVTAYLMKTEKLSVEDALASLRESSQGVCPNEGFMEQLKMFEEMGFKVDRESQIYKRFRVANLGTAFGRGERFQKSRFASDPGEDDTSLAESIGSQLKLEEENRVGTLYRCKKCQRGIASDKNEITHSLDLGEPVVRSRRRDGRRGSDDDYGEPKCSSIFVEPMQWMTTVIEGHTEGKLSCVKCHARLGSFHWAGLQCSCGAWVSPAFQLHKNCMEQIWR